MSRPCGGCERGAPFDGPYDIKRQCRLCWLYHNSPAYRAHWDGNPNVTSVSVIDPLLHEKLTALGVPISRPEPPGWFRKLVNFSGALVKHAWAGLPKTPTEEQERRINICLMCEFLRQEDGVCLKCGCGVIKKSGWDEQHCPIGKW